MATFLSEVSESDEVNEISQPEAARPELSHAHHYDFHALVELLRRLSPRQSDPLHDLTPEREPIRFHADASISFPRSDVVALHRDTAGCYHLDVSFIGLHGSQSPLPGYYLDALAWETAQGESGVADLLDLFHHRFVTLVHAIWRYHRYDITFQPGGTDPVSQRVFALMGLADPALRQTLDIAPGKMLAYAGVLASPVRPADTLSDLVTHCFDLPATAIQTWTHRWATLAEDEQNRLGARSRLAGKQWHARSMLGQNFVLGGRIPDHRGKFTLSITRLSRQRFMSLLPSGPEHLALITFVAYALPGPLAWALHLGMAPGEARGMRLGDPDTMSLGWSTFLGQRDEQAIQGDITLNIAPFTACDVTPGPALPRATDGDFESHFRHERDYMKALGARIAQEKPPLARFLGEQGQDAQVERLIEGFCLQSARVRQKLLSAFPHLTEGYLLRAWPFPLRPIPAVAVVQLHQALGDGPLTQRVTVPAGAEISTRQEKRTHHFVTCRPVTLQPISVIRRHLSHGVAQSHLTLTLRYDGPEPTWTPQPFTLYLGNDSAVAATLRLWCEQYQSDTLIHWTEEEHRLQQAIAVTLPPSPEGLIIPRDSDNYWALQHLVEGLTLRHVNDFITVDLGGALASLPGEGQEFTLTLTFDGTLPLQPADIEAAFIPHCVPVINLVPTRLEKLPFVAGQSRYTLPLSPHETLFTVQAVQCEKEPDSAQDAPAVIRFLPWQATPPEPRVGVEISSAGYQLQQEIGASGRRRYALNFCDQRGEPLTTFPHTHFDCDYRVMERHAIPAEADALWTVGWGMPPGMAVTMLSPPTSAFPALTDSHHHWRLISHLALSAHFLGSRHTLSQVMQDFAWHMTDELPQWRWLQQALDGIADITSVPEDRIVKGQLVRGRFITLTLTDPPILSPGEMYRFIGLLRVFFAHTLTRLSMVRVDVVNPAGNDIWHFSPMPGQRPML